MAQPNRERRKHKRHGLECPLLLGGSDGRVLAQSRSINVSDGGMLLPVPAGSAPPRGADVRVDFSVPRTTPNTRMLEEFTSQAIVVRHEPCDAEGPVRVAVQFERPMDLGLEV